MLKRVMGALGIATISVISIWLLGTIPHPVEGKASVDEQLLKLSGDLLLRTKTQDPIDSLLQQLSMYSTQSLATGISNDNARKTFWINLYNACFQQLARQGHKNPEIFTFDAIRFRDAAFSLDDIEHGILRRYRWKYSLGYWPQFWPGRTIKKLAVEKIDWRIHFALNCGAKSCPPIGVYQYNSLDGQLDLATRAFLAAETEFDDMEKTVHVTKLMQWFRGDFGGGRGIKKIFADYLKRDIASYKIQYQDYDWSVVLNNYKE
jgi:hypothetical protein